MNRQLRREVARLDFGRIGRQAVGGDLFAVDGVAGRETVEMIWGVVVAFDFDNDGISCPSQDLIGQMAGVSRWTVNRVLMALREAGVTAWTKARRTGSKWLHNRYAIPGRERVFLHRKALLRVLDRLRGRLPNAERTTTTSPRTTTRATELCRTPPVVWEEVDFDIGGRLTVVLTT